MFTTGFVMLAVALASNGCSESNQIPTAPTPPAAPSPIIGNLTVTGTSAFTAIGQIGQLIATATFSDGTTRNVTTDARWFSSGPSIVTVSASGVVTVAGFGAATIQATYQSRTATLQVTATPPGTFVSAGRVREPGRSGIGGVRVLETQSGSSALTDTDGHYSIAGLPALANAQLTFEKEGYEPGQIEAPPSTFIEMALQRVIRLTAGETVTPLQLAPHDLSYSIGADQCVPCRLIRVISPMPGTLHLRLTWTVNRSTLNLWAGGQRFSGSYPEAVADLPVSAGEVVVFAGMMLPAPAGGLDYVGFTLATAIRSGS